MQSGERFLKDKKLIMMKYLNFMGLGLKAL